MAKEKRDHTWSALLAAYEEGYDRVVKLLLDKRNPFKGMESETLTDRLWDFAETTTSNDFLQPYCLALAGETRAIESYGFEVDDVFYIHFEHGK
ncbi:uncharacterized protein N7446_009062 [Penicillium canescens]|uniref:uncharacterized protein n=1 Tax=Penicillium canescens TaxID=5083 RepID=UPI0026E0E722|nr:uncharacterized protein N7446_009062 [Penicillium canescens]KAJ6045976.1 hypothetical protein N7444_007230 [Penicillium canescens]KAJ6053050.1 hypothetical protein N7446_009062 [Penicillium canescens]KAJ6165138.1 hypothetical protein N7485_008382 [Penicillium canescens]